MPDTLIDWLRLHAKNQPKRLYARYLFADREETMDYGTTLERTQQYAAAYRAAGVKKAEVVLVVIEHDIDLMPAFLGVMWLGAIPAFLPHPNPKIDPTRYYQNLKGLIDRSKPVAVMSSAAVCEKLAEGLPDGPDKPSLLTPDLVTEERWEEPEPHVAEDVSCIQYSSGSTGLQKGAALSHRAILAEIEGVEDFFEITEQDSFFTWVPLYHDWGLVCVALHALKLGTIYTLQAPIDWVKKPVTAFQHVDKYKPTIYYHPNFAFNLMTQRIKDEDMQGLDISSLRLVCNGAEPCFYESHRDFEARFKRWGLPEGSLGIVYGMAEVVNSVIAAGHKEPIVVDRVSREILQSEMRAEPMQGETSPQVQVLLGVGRGLRGTEFKIVDSKREPHEERMVGEVAIRSRAAMHGYYGNEAATAASRDADGWYFTGDMGYRVGEILFITGRKSDMMIVGGVNIFPQDIEAIVGEHPHAVAGRIAAIGMDDPETGTQKILLIVESKSEDPEVLKDIARFARVEVSQRLDVVLSRVVHAPYTWLIKTTSGKIARIPNLKRLPELETANRTT